MILLFFSTGSEIPFEARADMTRTYQSMEDCLADVSRTVALDTPAELRDRFEGAACMTYPMAESILGAHGGPAE